MPNKQKILFTLIALMLSFFAASGQDISSKHRLPLRHTHEADSAGIHAVDSLMLEMRPDSVAVSLGELAVADTIPAEKESPYDRWEEREVAFNPDPNRAVWMSALFPGLGQLYNRRYWKLPIVIGGYMGLAYATSWNNTMLDDYTRAYRDIMDSDPSTNSYMNFFPPTTQESDLDRTWLTRILQSRKNTFRRNRDLCIIAMVGVYLVAMVDAYVDAQLSHFDITPDLSMDWSPQFFPQEQGMKPSIGLTWALNF